MEFGPARQGRFRDCRENFSHAGKTGPGRPRELLATSVLPVICAPAGAEQKVRVGEPRCCRIE